MSFQIFLCCAGVIFLSNFIKGFKCSFMLQNNAKCDCPCVSLRLADLHHKIRVKEILMYIAASSGVLSWVVK